jgi:hypothetical protein
MCNKYLHIQGTQMSYDMQIVDSAISEELRNSVWQYLLNSRWCTAWKPVGRMNYINYTPAVDSEVAHFRAMSRPNFATFQHRAGFASDDASLAAHPPLLELWTAINAQFDNQFTIEGWPEELPNDPADKSWEPPATTDTALEPGWRVYANAQHDETQKRTHGVHRDNPFVDIDNYWTILFCANPVWYPSWFADCVYYPDDDAGVTGDRQQIQNQHGGHNQNRNFPIGWPERIVAPAPGRIIAYDSRWLHTTHPAAAWAPVPRRVVAFRVRKK